MRDEIFNEVRKLVKSQYTKDWVGTRKEFNIDWEVGESWDNAINLTINKTIILVIREIEEKIIGLLKSERRA